MKHTSYIILLSNRPQVQSLEQKFTQQKPKFVTSHIILYDFGFKYFTDILNIN